MDDIYADAEVVFSQSDRSKEDFHVQPRAGPQAGSIASLLNPARRVLCSQERPRRLQPGKEDQGPKDFHLPLRAPRQRFCGGCPQHLV